MMFGLCGWIRTGDPSFPKRERYHCATHRDLGFRLDWGFHSVADCKLILACWILKSCWRSSGDSFNAWTFRSNTNKCSVHRLTRNAWIFYKNFGGRVIRQKVIKIYKVVTEQCSWFHGRHGQKGGCGGTVGSLVPRLRRYHAAK